MAADMDTWLEIARFLLIGHWYGTLVTVAGSCVTSYFSIKKSAIDAVMILLSNNPHRFGHPVARSAPITRQPQGLCPAAPCLALP
jgi:hypothetical protein